MRPKLDLANCILILRSCAQRPRTAQELQRSTGMSRSTFFRTLIDLREQLKACINCEDGRYAVADWGILNRRRVSIPRCTTRPEARTGVPRARSASESEPEASAVKQNRRTRTL